jgi:hypothetical protein
MSFVNYTNYAAYPQFQVPTVMRIPPTGADAQVTQGIPVSFLGANVMSVMNLQNVNSESAGLSPVPTTAQFSRQMMPGLFMQQSQQQMAYSMASSLNQPSFVVGPTTNNIGFFPGSFYNPRNR